VDVWGDAQQVCAAVGGLATVGVAAFGLLLWRATDELRDRTKTLGDKTADLATATFRLVEQTAEANRLVMEAARLDTHARLRPKLEVCVNYGTNGLFGALLVRHAPESESEYIDALAVEILSPNDMGEEHAGGPVVGPWRFKQGTDGADEYGRTADPRGPLRRGVTTRWALSFQSPTRHPNQWGAVQEDTPFVAVLKAAIGQDEWVYSAVVEPGFPRRMTKVP
jgi:hypothetical protein